GLRFHSRILFSELKRPQGKKKMSNNQDKKSEELEQALATQLELLKRESGELLKVGAAIAVGALVVYGIFKVTGKKNDRTTDKALEVLEKEGLLNEDIKTRLDRKSTRLNSSHVKISYAVFCLK